MLIAHDLIVWTQRLALTGELARAEPKRLLHVAARLAFHGRRAKLAYRPPGPGLTTSPPPSRELKRSPAPAG